MAYTGAALAIVGLGNSIYQGEQERVAAKRSLQAQEKAQSASLSAAIRQDRLAAQAQRDAQDKTPNVDAILGAEYGKAKTGMAGTLLSGPFGVEQARLRLGRPGLLGG